MKNKGYLKNCLLYVVKKKQQKINYRFDENILLKAKQITNQARKEEFLLGNHYLNILLKQYKKVEKLGRKKNGALSLPKGIQGNLSHSKKKIAICLSDCPNILSIGIDIIDKNRNIHPKLYQKIKHKKEKFFPTKKEILEIFCVKEAVIKCFGQLEKKVKFADIQILALNPYSIKVISQDIVTASVYLERKKNDLLVVFLLKKKGCK